MERRETTVNAEKRMRADPAFKAGMRKLDRQELRRLVGVLEIDFATGRATFDGTETYIGGTGRFSNATGQSHTFAEGSLFTNKATLTTAGTISY